LNRLKTAYSPYLQQHKNNPVDWYPWGEEALRRAKTENKIIILSIGYSACHWCHVMEHECFEDQEVADYMNAHFVSIKVDREERPDIDAIYMDACQNMGIRGGWPLNVFLMPDTSPFYGGTYFPKPNWLNVLYSIQESFLKQPEKLLESAIGVVNAINQSDLEKFNIGYNLKTIDKEEWKNTIDKLAIQFDPEHGGLQRSPKFPMPSVWNFVLNYLSIFSDKDNLSHLRFSLERMVLGGIFDHLAGGWTRYSTDERWKVPHFEKMLYDNGQLLSIYASFLVRNISANQNIDSNRLFEWALERTISWLKNEMTDLNGGFYAALDADSEGIEGKYYVWRLNEINAIKDPVKEEFKLDYKISNQGNWEHGNNILHLENLPINFANFKSIFQELKHIRDTRIRPGLDHKQLTSWNALTLNGLIDCYKYYSIRPNSKLIRKDLQVLIDNNLNFYENNLEERIDSDENESAIGLFHQLKPENGEIPILGFLDDYAALIKAYLNYYSISFNEKYLFKAEKLVKYTIANFYDPEEHLFYFTDTQGETLIARKKEIFDNVIPSSNALMASNLLLLSRYLSKNTYFDMASHMYAHMRELILRDPVWLSCWADFALMFTQNKTEVYVLGENYLEISQKVREYYSEPQILIFAASSASSLEVLKGKSNKRNITQIYVCQNKVCQLPVSDLKEAILILNSYGI
jgi:uncharacterized protein